MNESNTQNDSRMLNRESVQGHTHELLESESDLNLFKA